MKYSSVLLAGAVFFLSLAADSATHRPPARCWSDIPARDLAEPKSAPDVYRALRLDQTTLNELLGQAPREFTPAAESEAAVLELPMPDGGFTRFRVVESPMLEAETARQFPTIRNYSGQGIDEPAATMRCDLTVNGFHAIILSTAGSIFIEPFREAADGSYISYFTRDDPRRSADRCFTPDEHAREEREPLPNAFRQAQLRTYRLAAAATAEYTQQFRTSPSDTDPTLIQRAAGDINTVVMAVNAIYNRDLAVRMTLLMRNDIIFTDAMTDPYTSGDTVRLQTQNQSTLDAIVGDANYDVGHVFDRGNMNGGGSGQAQIAKVCQTGEKAKGTTGGRTNSILAAHEMGHQFGASHTFNANQFGACFSLGGVNQRVPETAYEPGSGSSLMSYCGTCSDGAGTADLQQSRDLFFNESSLEQIIAYTGPAGAGNNCAVVTDNGNNGIQMATTSEIYVPVETPFQLTVFAQDIDPINGNVTVSWEEHDLGPASPPNDDDGDRPIFRAYPPTLVRTRNFPRLDYILNNGNDPPETYNCGTAMNPVTCVTGEKLPRVQRTGGNELVFRAVARDNDSRGGSVNSVTTRVHIIQTNMGGFRVSSPGNWAQGSRRLITWQNVGTNNPPFNVANVRISLSTDGGTTFPTVLVESTPNDGSEPVFLPESVPLSSTARIKVEAIISGFHSFFDITDTNFAIIPLSVTQNGDAGEGSLRQAILDANSDPGLTRITFDVRVGFGVETIQLEHELPLITAPVILDGWSQGGAGYSGPPLIELNGVNADPGFINNGLTISAGNCTVQGLIINRFSGSGIDIRTNGGNKIIGCYIGVNANGTLLRANALSGILINNTPGNEIGRAAPGAENIISGNNVGVRIVGANASGNEVRNNYIGTNSAGADLGNTLDGVRLEGAPQNLIGGTRDAGGGIILPTGNVISGNGASGASSNGIEVTGAGAFGNMIEANLIGLNPAGTAALGNFGNGILIANAPGTVIGGSGAARNYIAGNLNASGGIYLNGSGASGTVIFGNYLGTNVAGTSAIPNNATNITVESANNQIQDNLISGTNTGVYLAFGGATGNSIRGNYIGTNAAGSAALNSTGTGIEIRNTDGNTIGGAQAGMGNLISGNFTGIRILSSVNQTVQNNLIGTNPTGTAAVPNVVGLVVDGGANNTIGGTIGAAGNVISGNGTGGNDHGIRLANTTNALVQGNRIGTNAAGTAALGNGGHGIQVFNSFNCTIGGNTPEARNLISGNGGNGIALNAVGTIVRGNYIGTDVNGTADLGNGHPTGAAGIEIAGSGNNTIGGTNPGEGNIIAFNGCAGCFGVNGGSGVRIFSTSNRIRGNSIFGNVELGIDLSGGAEGANRVTPNDSCDGDNGPNNLQNFPVLTAASGAGNSTNITGSLNSTANAAYTIDFYASPSCDPAGNGEGQTWLGSTMVNTDGSCTAPINATLSAALAPGSVVTATATDFNGNTSEFSACVSADVVALQSAVSRKLHNGVAFDVALPLSGSPGVEPRIQGSTGDHQIVVTFDAPVTVNGSPQAEIVAGTGAVGAGGVPNGGAVIVEGATVTVPLTNVSNAQVIRVRLNSVNGLGSPTIPMALLLGDASGNGSVASSDVGFVKSVAGQMLTPANFRADVNTSGGINATDLGQVKAQSGMMLP